MNYIHCTNCQTELPLESVFCKKCGTQLKCKYCGATREANANFCISCGEALSLSVGNSERAINRIEFSQKGNSKNMIANFTDEVGVYLASAFNSVVTGQPIPPKNPFRNPLQINSSKNNNNNDISKETSNNIQDAEVIETNFAAIIAKIFKQNGDDKLEIIDNRLKEKSKHDKMKRLSVLFLYAKKLSGIDSVSRAELNEIVRTEKLVDNNYRNFLAKDGLKYFSLKTDGTFSLLAGGNDYAEQILQEIANPDYRPSQSKAGRKAGKKSISSSPSTNEVGGKKNSSSNLSALEMLKKLISENYFSAHRKLNDIVTYCSEKKVVKFSPQNMSAALSRLVKDEILDRETKDGQYEYWKK